MQLALSTGQEPVDTALEPSCWEPAQLYYSRYRQVSPSQTGFPQPSDHSGWSCVLQAITAITVFILAQKSSVCFRYLKEHIWPKMNVIKRSLELVGMGGDLLLTAVPIHSSIPAGAFGSQTPVAQAWPPALGCSWTWQICAHHVLTDPSLWMSLPCRASPQAIMPLTRLSMGDQLEFVSKAGKAPHVITMVLKSSTHLELQGCYHTDCCMYTFQERLYSRLLTQSHN